MAIARRKRRRRLEFDPLDFPRLTNKNHRVTSDPVEEQNCIAFAAGDKIRWWWPVHDWGGPLPPPYFWPLSCPLKATPEAFACAFKIAGFEKCAQAEDGQLEDRIEKIAVFSMLVSDKDGARIEVTHAAIQSPMRNNKWRSKMGKDEDIEHDTLVAVSGRAYGQIDFFMKRSFEARDAALELLKRRLPSH